MFEQPKQHWVWITIAAPIMIAFGATLLIPATGIESTGTVLEEAITATLVVTLVLAEIAAHFTSHKRLFQ